MSLENDIFIKELRAFSDVLKRHIRNGKEAQLRFEDRASASEAGPSRAAARGTALYYRYRIETLVELLSEFAEHFSDYDDFVTTREDRP